METAAQETSGLCVVCDTERRKRNSSVRVLFSVLSFISERLGLPGGVCVNSRCVAWNTAELWPRHFICRRRQHCTENTDASLDLVSVSDCSRPTSLAIKLRSNFLHRSQLNRLSTDFLYCIRLCGTAKVLWKSVTDIRELRTWARPDLRGGGLDSSPGASTKTVIQFSAFVNHRLEEENDKTSRHHFLYKLWVDKKIVDTFPNVEIMIRMYLVLVVTNCSGERSFSKLIKNRLRITMTNDILSHLTLTSIEYDILRQIDFTKLVKDFAKAKFCKVPGL